MSGHCPEPWTLCLVTFCLEVKKFWFQNQSFLGSLSLVEDPDWHILVLRGDSHLSKVVIKKIEANGEQDEDYRHWSQTSWV